jgi:hypothetical protein
MVEAAVDQPDWFIAACHSIEPMAQVGWDHEFESPLLQRRVQSEPDFRGIDICLSGFCGSRVGEDAVARL